MAAMQGSMAAMQQNQIQMAELMQNLMFGVKQEQPAHTRPPPPPTLSLVATDGPNKDPVTCETEEEGHNSCGDDDDRQGVAGRGLPNALTSGYRKQGATTSLAVTEEQARHIRNR